MGLGLAASSGRASTATTTRRRFRPATARNILQSELNNPAIEPIAKKYAELRYQLMPYTYTLAREARDRGLPLMRAMWLHYPDDARARGIGDQFLWGRDLLIAPVYTKGATVARRLPAGRRLVRLVDERDARPAARHVTRAVDLATMPIYVRAGAIIPVDPVRQYTGAARHRADDAARLSAAPTASSRCTTTTGSARSISTGAATGSG